MISVACVMLANGRIDMVRRAIESFRLQTYPFESRKLIIWNTGEFLSMQPTQGPALYLEHIYQPLADDNQQTIGALRNEANSTLEQFDGADIICHWDSDDWSHPNRIAEQVALLQGSGKQCVGYRDMLFWNSTEGHFCGAWLYANPDPRYCLGTSLCYWRSAWEARPFPDLPKKRGDRGEDVEWLREIDSLGVTSIEMGRGDCEGDTFIPRMVASIHGGNTQYYGADLLEQSTSWRRAPEWDGYCAERMRL